MPNTPEEPTGPREAPDEPTPDPDVEKSSVQINYKSGITMVIECDEFTVKKRGSQVTGIEWLNAAPDPMHLGIDAIESVWQLS